MIRALVDFALDKRFLILAAALLLLSWGGVAFDNVPVEAYPDVANDYVTVITQWPGRAAEDVEQQAIVATRRTEMPERYAMDIERYDMRLNARNG